MSLFNNIRNVPRVGTERAKVDRWITKFIVRRCAPIISHRLRSDKFIFQDMTLDKILKGWKPGDGDHFVKAECEIPQCLILPFRRRGIECRLSNGKYFAPWSKDIAPIWMEKFLWILSFCKSCLKIGKVAGKTIHTLPLRWLQAIVRREGFKYLLELESVRDVLDPEVLKRRRGTIFFNVCIVPTI
jgi:hypothetical protein